MEEYNLVNEAETVKDRLLLYLKYKGLTNRAFQTSLGLSNAYVSNLVGSILPRQQQAISEKYPDLNMKWLITGEGEMIADMSNSNIQIHHNKARNIGAVIKEEGGSDKVMELMAKQAEHIEALLKSNETKDAQIDRLIELLTQKI